MQNTLTNTPECKLELRHLAPYLPYGLKMHNPKSGQTVTVIGLSNTPETGVNIIIDLKNSGYKIGAFKPILKPLSMLENHFNNYRADIYSDFDYYIRCIRYGEMEFSEYDWFFQEHFDVFGLIDTGLAVKIQEVEG